MSMCKQSCLITQRILFFTTWWRPTCYTARAARLWRGTLRVGRMVNALNAFPLPWWSQTHTPKDGGDVEYRWRQDGRWYTRGSKSR
jgi:hypothetical protein